MNPSGSCRVCKPNRTGHWNWRAHQHPLGPVGALVDPGDHDFVPAPTPLEPAGSAVRGVGTCDTGGGVRTVQVTGLFDLSPSSVPSRQVHESPPQVHRRSVRGRRELARHRSVRSRPSMSSRCILQARQARHAVGVVAQMKATAPGGTVRRRPKRYPGVSKVLATARKSRGPCVGQTAGPQ
jgi:hypothetical protein